MAELLVRHGASVNVADLWKFTPLHEAAAKGKYEICKLLLKVSRRRIPGLSDQSERRVTNTSSGSHGDVPELCKCFISIAITCGRSAAEVVRCCLVTGFSALRVCFQANNKKRDKETITVRV